MKKNNNENIQEDIEEYFSEVEQKFIEIVDSGLTSNNRKIRINSLESLLMLFNDQFMKLHDILSLYEEGLIEGLKYNLTKGNEEEKVKTMEIITRLALFEGVDSYVLIPHFCSLIMALISPSSPYPSLFPLGVKTKAIILFTGGSIDVSESFIRELVEMISMNDNDDHIAAALQSISFLISTLPRSLVCDLLSPSTMEKLMELLRSNNETVKLYAAALIAFLISSYRDFSLGEGETMELKDMEGFISVDELTYQFECFNEDERGNRLKKMDKPFSKLIYQSIFDNIEPKEDNIKIKASTIKIEGWDRIFQIRFFRDILGASLQSHFIFNPLFEDIFQFNLHFDLSARPKQKIERVKLWRQKSKKRSLFLNSARTSSMKQNITQIYAP